MAAAVATPSAHRQPRPQSMSSMPAPSPDALSPTPSSSSLSASPPSPSSSSSSSSSAAANAVFTQTRPDVARRHTAYLTAPTRARPLRSSPLAGPSLALARDGTILAPDQSSAASSAASVAHSAPAHLPSSRESEPGPAPPPDAAKKKRRLSLGLLRLRSMPALAPGPPSPSAPGAAADPPPPVPPLPVPRARPRLTPTQAPPKRRSWLLPPEHSSSVPIAMAAAYAPAPPPMARRASSARTAPISPSPSPRGSPAPSLRALPRPASYVGPSAFLGAGSASASAPRTPAVQRRKSYLQPGLIMGATDPEANWLTVSAPPRFSRDAIPLRGVVMPVPRDSREGRRARARALGGGGGGVLAAGAGGTAASVLGEGRSRSGSAGGRQGAGLVEAGGGASPSLSELARQFSEGAVEIPSVAATAPANANANAVAGPSSPPLRASPPPAATGEIREEPRNPASGFQVLSRPSVAQPQLATQSGDQVAAPTPSAGQGAAAASQFTAAVDQSASAASLPYAISAPPTLSSLGSLVSAFAPLPSPPVSIAEEPEPPLDPSGDEPLSSEDGGRGGRARAEGNAQLPTPAQSLRARSSAGSLAAPAETETPPATPELPADPRARSQFNEAPEGEGDLATSPLRPPLAPFLHSRSSVGSVGSVTSWRAGGSTPSLASDLGSEASAAPSLATPLEEAAFAVASAEEEEGEGDVGLQVMARVGEDVRPAPLHMLPEGEGKGAVEARRMQKGAPVVVTVRVQPSAALEPKSGGSTKRRKLVRGAPPSASEVGVLEAKHKEEERKERGVRGVWRRVVRSMRG